MNVSGATSAQLGQIQASMLAAVAGEQESGVESVESAMGADLSFMGIGQNIDLQA